MMYTKHNLSYFLTLILFFCIVAAGKAQVLPFYNVTPLEDDDYFTKTVFSFNPAFMKGNKVKSILLQSEEKVGMTYIYNLNPDGMVVSTTSIRYNNEKPDTAFYTRYYYNLNGLIDKKARIDYSNGIVKVSSFQYNKNNKIDIIRTFTLNAQMPNRPQNNDWQGEQFPGVDNVILEGALPDESLWKKMTANNDFSSLQYRYYTENEFEAEERTEYFNFSKNSGSSDTCYQKKTYYYLKGHPVVLFLHNGCAVEKTPSELYQFKDGLLVQLTDAPSSLDPKTEKYVYDQNRNLKLMEDSWNGRKVSELGMSYDEKGFLIFIQRKSDATKAHYFEDRILKAIYGFY
ncbi:hypothetical protein I6I98_04380 [Sphingobacterium multivorum]|uniref:DUF4595 domain-containing protein n=1 Tax=Sphingobacterium multivorum TaxID=28454 RepID=A0ABX7CT85_SPHMU|nr:hypothetical protein [Sphingobacterium multivorum]QQT54503.1 hypothetical protein I6I98_04380 [Sphingobacterium multivorum]